MHQSFASMAPTSSWQGWKMRQFTDNTTHLHFFFRQITNCSSKTVSLCCPGELSCSRRARDSREMCPVFTLHCPCSSWGVFRVQFKSNQTVQCNLKHNRLLGLWLQMTCCSTLNVCIVLKNYEPFHIWSTENGCLYSEVINETFCNHTIQLFSYHI